MFEYQLSDFTEDEHFLERKTVTCRIALRANQYLLEGEDIVIKLSTGKSYKGTVLKLQLIPLRNHLFGEMVVLRA